MRKKIWTIVGVIAVLAVVLSLTAFAKDGAAELTNYSFITVLHKEIVMLLNAVFKSVDAVYIFFRDLFA